MKTIPQKYRPKQSSLNSEKKGKKKVRVVTYKPRILLYDKNPNTSKFEVNKLLIQNIEDTYYWYNNGAKEGCYLFPTLFGGLEKEDILELIEFIKNREKKQETKEDEVVENLEKLPPPHVFAFLCWFAPEKEGESQKKYQISKDNLFSKFVEYYGTLNSEEEKDVKLLCDFNIENKRNKEEKIGWINRRETFLDLKDVIEINSNDICLLLRNPDLKLHSKKGDSYKFLSGLFVGLYGDIDKKLDYSSIIKFIRTWLKKDYLDLVGDPRKFWVKAVLNDIGFSSLENLSNSGIKLRVGRHPKPWLESIKKAENGERISKKENLAENGNLTLEDLEEWKNQLEKDLNRCLIMKGLSKLSERPFQPKLLNYLETKLGISYFCDGRCHKEGSRHKDQFAEALQHAWAHYSSWRSSVYNQFLERKNLGEIVPVYNGKFSNIVMPYLQGQLDSPKKKAYLSKSRLSGLDNCLLEWRECESLEDYSDSVTRVQEYMEEDSRIDSNLLKHIGDHFFKDEEYQNLKKNLSDKEYKLYIKKTMDDAESLASFHKYQKKLDELKFPIFSYVNIEKNSINPNFGDSRPKGEINLKEDKFFKENQSELERARKILETNDSQSEKERKLREAQIKLKVEIELFNRSENRFVKKYITLIDKRMVRELCVGPIDPSISQKVTRNHPISLNQTGVTFGIPDRANGGLKLIKDSGLDRSGNPRFYVAWAAKFELDPPKMNEKEFLTYPQGKRLLSLHDGITNPIAFALGRIVKNPGNKNNILDVYDIPEGVGEEEKTKKPKKPKFLCHLELENYGVYTENILSGQNASSPRQNIKQLWEDLYHFSQQSKFSGTKLPGEKIRKSTISGNLYSRWEKRTDYTLLELGKFAKRYLRNLNKQPINQWVTGEGNVCFNWLRRMMDVFMEPKSNNNIVKHYKQGSDGGLSEIRLSAFSQLTKACQSFLNHLRNLDQQNPNTIEWEKYISNRLVIFREHLKGMKTDKGRKICSGAVNNIVIPNTPDVLVYENHSNERSKNNTRRTNRTMGDWSPCTLTKNYDDMVPFLRGMFYRKVLPYNINSFDVINQDNSNPKASWGFRYKKFCFKNSQDPNQIVDDTKQLNSNFYKNFWSRKVKRFWGKKQLGIYDKEIKLTLEKLGVDFPSKNKWEILSESEKTNSIKNLVDDITRYLTIEIKKRGVLYFPDKDGRWFKTNFCNGDLLFNDSQHRSCWDGEYIDIDVLSAIHLLIRALRPIKKNIEKKSKKSLLLKV